MTDERAARLASAPINRREGYRFGERESGRAEVSLEPCEEQLQVEGIVHGGVLATLADTASVYAIFPDLGEECTMTSIEFKLNFLRPARVEGGELSARARVLKVGRSVATAETEIWQAGEAVAKGLFTYLVLPVSSS